MFGDAVPHRDLQILDDLTYDDLDTDSFDKYRTQLKIARGNHPFLAASDEEFAGLLGAMKYVKGVWCPTFAGLLMFGKEASIRELLPHWHLSFKDTSSGQRRWDTRISPDGTWNANIFQFYSRVYYEVTAHVKVPFALGESGQRIDETDVHYAIREALVNQLIHADYRSATGLHIVRCGSEIEFANPGVLLVTEEQFWAGGVSQCRNLELQRMFHIINVGEHEGSGGPTIRSTWDRHTWKRPTLAQDFVHNRTRLVLSEDSLIPKAVVDEAKERLGEDIFETVTPLGGKVLLHTFSEGLVTHSRLAELFPSEHRADITETLAQLCAKGLLKSSGRSRGTVYRVAVLAGDEGEENGFTPKSSDSPIPEVCLSKRASSREVELAILKICEGEFRSLEEIASSLERSEYTVRAKYLPHMVTSGVLIRRFDTANHPNQAYRTA